MKLGLDISQIIYSTGVSDYTLNLVNNLLTLSSPGEMVLFGSSLRRRKEINSVYPSAKTYSLPPSVLHLMWNKLHVLDIENFVGMVDVYHSSDWTQPPSVAKKVTTVHDMSPFLFPKDTDPYIVSVQTARMHWVVRECDAVICVSDSTAADFTRLFNYPGDKIKVIPEALPSRFLHSPRPSYSYPYIVAIGARQPRKNIANLVSAFVKFKSRYSLPDRLVVIGENRKMPSHSDVEYTGYVPDQKLVDLLAGSTAFVYPSLSEGFGLPILGAFHHRVPVACSDIPVFRELAATSASYFDPANEEDIARGIQTAIKNRKQLIASGTKQSKNYSWQKTAEATLNVYKSLC